MFSPGESLVDVDPFDALLEEVLAEEEMPPKKAAQTTPKKIPSKADEAAGMDAFAKELEGDSDEDLQHVQHPSAAAVAAAAPVMREQPERSEPAVYGETASQPQEQRGWLQKLWKGGEGTAVADDAFETNGVQLSDAERELIKEELKKTEDEILTLRQVLNARQKHASELKRKLGLSPLSELTQDVTKSLKGVTESDAYKQTSEVAAATAETVKSKFNDMRNSSLFKSFESKLGTAYTSAKMTASTSIDKLSGAARGPSAASTPANEQAPPMP
ncbi:hypothetical protein PRIPAC_76559 [Pristionchus pacificus]|uniref:Uncharacterized protein n=1 Tax=Pristionchus pacificus TaxID=54126 RepID=A0A2A6C6K1_PRIPA|nr:hypothetical protein PRIPAC_76559 [Pristionchus pacificus]|eukprot:PDM73651.1 hypothetical protein PRIPAC_41007 [Pristionchus pacificus]